MSDTTPAGVKLRRGVRWFRVVTGGVQRNRRECLACRAGRGVGMCDNGPPYEGGPPPPLSRPGR